MYIRVIAISKFVHTCIVTKNILSIINTNASFEVKIFDILIINTAPNKLIKINKSKTNN